MTFKTWNANGTAKTYHRTDVLNAVANASGLAGVKMAAQWLGNNERVTGVQAQEAYDFGVAFA